MTRIVRVLHGPNLNMLGTREPGIYGSVTLAAINAALAERATALGITLTALQSNHEGVLIDAVQAATGLTGSEPAADGLILNPGGFTHTSVALRDAIAQLPCPAIEIHLSNVHARELFRHTSLIAPVTHGQITGLGWRGYLVALDYLAMLFDEAGNQASIGIAAETGHQDGKAPKPPKAKKAKGDARLTVEGNPS